MSDAIQNLCERAQKFRDVAHLILAKYETAPSRIISLDKTRQEIANLTLYQDELFGEALSCIEKGCFRAAHVMAWAAFMDFLEEKLTSDNLKAVKTFKKGWEKFNSTEELRENVSEYQLIEAAKDVGLLSKQEMKALHGLLAKRNECAHPSGYNPSMNEAIGYFSELLTRIKKIESRRVRSV